MIFSFDRLYKTRNIAIMLILIWATSFAIMIPTWFRKWGRFGLDVSIGSCSILPDEKNRSPKKVLFLTAFTLPCVAIIICYARIFFIVRKATKKSMNTPHRVQNVEELSSTETSTSMTARITADCSSSYNTERNESHLGDQSPRLQRCAIFKLETRDETIQHSDDPKQEPSRLRRTALRKSMALLKLSLPTRKDRRLGTMIMAIMTSFCLCHLPITITKVLHEITPNPASNIAAYLLLYLASSINPIIYVVMSNEYRKAYKNLFRRRTKASLSLRNNKNPS